MPNDTSPTKPSLPPYKRDLLHAITAANCLTFGTYTLKSGRQSPYFFNAGRLLNAASLLRRLASAYAAVLTSHDPPLHFDVLFGPAYKAIPLAAVAATRLAEVDEARFGHVGCAFNRKEVKRHGDGGGIVGAEMRGRRVVIVDDVMTAGTAIREAVDIIEREGGVVAGIVVALDRMEKVPAGEGESDDDGRARPSTIGEVRRRYGVPVTAVLTLDDIIEGFEGVGGEEDLRRLKDYRERWRPTD